MKSALCQLAFLLLSGLAALAGEGGGITPTATAQTFYDGYVKVADALGDCQKYVLSSPACTAGFKKAYQKMMADPPDSDPIIRAQDTPEAGYRASPAKLKKGKAIVTMTGDYGETKVSINVTLTKVGGAWLISGIEDLKSEEED
jgi:hypothetical protein